ncbi:MAG: universal stress protein [Myxococcales bacterium]|nr:universal stress protein [Myxococcales bacterium]MCB9671806.1 universal stress protein [Alphaproteobacteria bacterium]
MRALVAVDIFEPGHEALIQHAAEWAGKLGATLDVGYVDGMSYVRPAILDKQLRDILDSEMERLKEAREKQLEDLVQKIPEGVRGVGRYRYDYPAVEAFLEMSEGYDLVLVGTHGRQGLVRFVLGSFAEKIVRQCKVPTLVMRTHLPE